MKAGEVVLGELLGDPDPTGAVTSALRAGVAHYRARCREAFAPLRSDDHLYPICNDLTVGRFGDFAAPARMRACTELAAEVAGLVAESALAAGHADLRVATVEG
jgi:hypothetical protein